MGHILLRRDRHPCHRPLCDLLPVDFETALVPLAPCMDISGSVHQAAATTPQGCRPTECLKVLLDKRYPVLFYVWFPSFVFDSFSYPMLNMPRRFLSGALTTGQLSARHSPYGGRHQTNGHQVLADTILDDCLTAPFLTDNPRHPGNPNVSVEAKTPPPAGVAIIVAHHVREPQPAGRARPGMVVRLPSRTRLVAFA